MSTKVSYKSILKSTLAEFDMSRLTDVKGPMLEPILSYTGDGELETHKKNAASVLERYYFSEKEPPSVSLPDTPPDTGESIDVKQPQKEDVSNAQKTKKAIKDEIGGEDGSLEKVTESDSIEDRLFELEESFLMEMEEINEAKGPGGHEADGTGPHGRGEGPGQGKADGSGMKDDSDLKNVAEAPINNEFSFEDSLIALESDLESTIIEEDDINQNLVESQNIDDSDDIISENSDMEIEDLETTVLEAMLSELDDDSNDNDVSDDSTTSEKSTNDDGDDEKKDKDKDNILDVDKAMSEGGGFGPLDPDAEDRDIMETLAIFESEMEDDNNVEDVDNIIV